MNSDRYDGALLLLLKFLIFHVHTAAPKMKTEEANELYRQEKSKQQDKFQ